MRNRRKKKKQIHCACSYGKLRNQRQGITITDYILSLLEYVNFNLLKIDEIVHECSGYNGPLLFIDKSSP